MALFLAAVGLLLLAGYRDLEGLKGPMARLTGIALAPLIYESLAEFCDPMRRFLPILLLYVCVYGGLMAIASLRRPRGDLAAVGFTVAVVLLFWGGYATAVVEWASFEAVHVYPLVGPGSLP